MCKDPVKELLHSSHDVAALRTLATAYPHLSPAEQTVAQYILSHPQAIAGLSASQLAAASGASEATVFRLCRNLGFAGYSDLRDKVSTAVSCYDPDYLSPASLAHAPGALKDGPSSQVMDAAIYYGIRVLMDVAAIPNRHIQDAADAILSSRRLILAGVGGYTARIAEMAAFGLQRVGITCMLWLDAQLGSVTGQMFTADDAVLGVSYSGNNKAVTRVLELASEAGATTIALTNYPLSPVAKASRVPLATSFREARIQNFDLLPRLSQLLVIDALIREVAARGWSSKERDAANQR